MLAAAGREVAVFTSMPRGVCTNFGIVRCRCQDFGPIQFGSWLTRLAAAGWLAGASADTAGPTVSRTAAGLMTMTTNRGQRMCIISAYLN